LGRETQAETGWVDLMQRMYEPPLGRFTSVDPVTASQESLSTYQYGWNNPVLRSDRNGDCPVCIVFAFVALFTASQPANTPTHNKVENARAYQETKRNYDTAIISALTPAPPVSSKPSVIVFQAIKSEVKSEIKNELKKQVQTEIGKSNARSESKYENATLPNSTKNIKTDVTKSEFGANLQKSGYEKTTSKDGTTSVYTKEGNKYSVRDKADSHDGPTADFKKAGSDTKKTDLKIRLEKD
jgi:RHS repeat-associated protein